MRNFKLPCYDGHKSFYGRASVTEFDDKNAMLYSYNRFVASIENGKYIQAWDGYSATTQRHIDSFRTHYGLSPRPKESAKRRFINKWFSGNEKGYRKVRREHRDRVVKKWKIFLEEEKNCGNITIKQYKRLVEEF